VTSRAAWPALAAVLLLLLVSAPAAALADAIGPPPPKCPRGSAGVSSHEGEWCEPTTCATDLDCPDARCTLGVGLCVTRQTVPCGGLWNPANGPCTVELAEAHGSCKQQSDCKTGTCELARRCLPTMNPIRALSRSDCGCSAGGPQAVGAAVGLGMVLLGVVGLRRWRWREGR
jgi:hypothetical protein